MTKRNNDFNTVPIQIKIWESVGAWKNKNRNKTGGKVWEVYKMNLNIDICHETPERNFSPVVKAHKM